MTPQEEERARALAQFSVALPEGGHFKASWPKDITKRSLRMAESMLLPTLDMWKDHKQTETERDASIEVDSWLAETQRSSHANGSDDPKDSATEQGKPEPK